MSMFEAVRRMPARSGRTGATRGEAAGEAVSDEALGPRRDPNDTGNPYTALLDAAPTRENLQRAFKRVRANKGAAGVDGLDIDQTSRLLATTWPAIREQPLTGRYRPQPVRKVTTPKPHGGEREPGIPTVTDRLIQQALLQILQPIPGPAFSEHSYGFKPVRRTQDAVLAAQAYVRSGRRVVADVDLEKFFDRVHHDILIDRLRSRIDDTGVIRLVRAYLNSGIMVGGVVQERYQGTPQGGPLSPLLANVMLDEVDKELERRDHCFVRYADDAIVHLRSRQSGEQVMALLRRLYGRLQLTVNEAKSAVAPVVGRKFLGYSFWVAREGKVKCRMANKPLATFKQRVRWLTRRSGGRSMRQVVDGLRPTCWDGWKAYFGLAQTPQVWRELDRGLRLGCGPSSSSSGGVARPSTANCVPSAPPTLSPDQWLPTATAGGIAVRCCLITS